LLIHALAKHLLGLLARFGYFFLTDQLADRVQAAMSL